MQVRPVSPDVLVDEIADRVAALPADPWVRVAVDGAPATDPDGWADALVDPLRLRGRHAVRVRTADFLRPASLRLERGRTNPDAFYEDWLDLRGLAREVLDPLGPGGTGHVLTSLWNAETDRATRAPYVDVPPGAVLLLSGALLLGAGLSVDWCVHLSTGPAALARRTPESDRWTLPAFERYSAEVMPEYLADMVVRVDDPRHPAVVDAH